MKMKHIFTIIIAFAIISLAEAQVKFTQVERAEVKWSLPVAKRIIPGVSGYAMMYVPWEDFRDSLSIGMDSIYVSNDTIYLRDGSGYVFLQDNDPFNEISNIFFHSGGLREPGQNEGDLCVNYFDYSFDRWSGFEWQTLFELPRKSQAGYGIIINENMDDPADRYYEIEVDTSLIATWYGLDSIINNLPSSIKGTGTATRVAFWASSDSLSSNTNLYWNNSDNRLGVGTSSPASIVDVAGSLTGSQSTPAFRASQSWNTSGTPSVIKGSATNTSSFFGRLLDLEADGNTLLTIPAINGAIYFGNLLASSGSAIGPSNPSNGSFTPNGNAVSLAHRVTGSNAGYGIHYTVLTGSRQATSGESGNLRFAETFNPTSGTGTYNVAAMYPIVNQTGGANGITRGLLISPTLTAAAGWRSIDMTNNSGYGIYQSGASAINYFNGKIGVSNTSPTYNIDVTGNVRLTERTGTAVTMAAYASDGKLVEAGLSGLSISGGTLTAADGSATNELQTISTTGASGNITLSNGGGTLNLNVNDADASATNELITAVTSMGLSGGGNTIVITEAGVSRTGVIPPMVGATAGVAGTQGVVPAPAAGNQNKFLRGDATWQDVATISGTTGYIPYYNSSSTLTPSAVSFSTTGVNGIGFGIAPNAITSDIHLGTGKQLEFDGTATIIDKDNSGGSANAFLTRAATGGGIQWRGLGTINGASLLDGNITITTGVTGSGLSGRVPYWTSSTNISYNDNFFWDNTNSRLGIGTLSPSRNLDVTGTSRFRSAIYDSGNSSGTAGQVMTSQGTSAWTWSTLPTSSVILATNNSTFSTTVTGARTLELDQAEINTSGFTFDNANDYITVNVTGVYEITFSGNMGYDVASLNIYFERWNGSTWDYIYGSPEGRIPMRVDSNNSPTVYITSIASLNNGDRIRVRRSHSTSYTFYHSNSALKIKRIS